MVMQSESHIWNLKLIRDERREEERRGEERRGGERTGEEGMRGERRGEERGGRLLLNLLCLTLKVKWHCHLSKLIPSQRGVCMSR